jgi:hypothetical protein
MVGMVGKIVAGLRMGEDGEAVAVEREPLGDIAEQVSRDGQLAASARMGADRSQMEMPDGDRKPRLRSCGERTRELDLLGIEIDVRVEIADRRFGHAPRLTRLRRAVATHGRLNAVGSASLGRRLVYKRALSRTVAEPPAGASPSGKAPVFGTGIRRFESCRPSQPSPYDSIFSQ